MKSKQTAIVFLGLLGISLFSMWFLGHQNQTKNTVGLGNEAFYVRVADTDTEREKGLSGTPRLGRNEGMLFKFDKVGQYCFWMKDMNYPLDIIWVGEDKKIVIRYKNLPPDSYPRSFCSAEPAKYVIEVPAGTVDRLHLKIGDQVSF